MVKKNAYRVPVITAHSVYCLVLFDSLFLYPIILSFVSLSFTICSKSFSVSAYVLCRFVMLFVSHIVFSVIQANKTTRFFLFKLLLCYKYHLLFLVSLLFQCCLSALNEKCFGCTTFSFKLLAWTEEAINAMKVVSSLLLLLLLYLYHMCVCVRFICQIRCFTLHLHFFLWIVVSLFRSFSYKSFFVCGSQVLLISIYVREVS